MGSKYSCVIIESPYAGDIEHNIKYLQECIRDCVSRMESPYASHQMLTQALDDNNEGERQQGIDAGLAWADKAEKVVVYEDLGISKGMVYAIENHVKKGRRVEYRKIRK